MPGREIACGQLPVHFCGHRLARNPLIQEEQMMNFTATYSPEDNKLRLYASSRLDRDDFERLKVLGFRYAPKQDLFVAPMWTPEREDVLLEFAGEIGDEDSTLVDRAEVRAERFDGYSEKRSAEASVERKRVDQLTEIMNGQPVLIGHHSEKRHRRDLQRMGDSMRKSLNCWRAAQYWERRAKGALQHAKYRESAPVRARRIKRLEAEERKALRALKTSKEFLTLWGKVCDEDTTQQQKRAAALANIDRVSPVGTWSALNQGTMTAAEALQQALSAHNQVVVRQTRWAEHFANRLTYERALLKSSGYEPPAKRKSAAAKLPLLNYRAESVSVQSRYRAEPMVLGQVELTKGEYRKKNSDFKSTHVCEGTHRVRVVMVGGGLSAVFLTDSKVHQKPAS